MSLIDLLAYAQNGSGLLATAQPYLKELAACIDGSGACPAKLFALETSDRWQKMIDEAADRLIYCDPFATVDTKSLSESWQEDDAIPKKSIAVFDAVLSTSQKDRDGDILRTEGMRLEKSMPLLWQHVWSQPIGVMVKNIEQNANHVFNKYALADTDLGKDAATLAEMGALRMSHGFHPVPGQFEPLGTVKRADGKTVPTGWDIKECNVFESSLVSVPANAGAKVLRFYEKEFDAVCQAVSGGKLHSDPVKSWAKNLSDKRTRVFTGVDFEARLDDHIASTAKMLGDLSAKLESITVKEPETKEPAPCGCKSAKPAEQPAGTTPWLKSFSESANVKSYGLPDALPGSFEQVQMQVQKLAPDYLRANDIDIREYDDSVYIVGTFADSVVLCKRDWRKGTEKCYRASWGFDSDGKVELTGTPEKVEIEATITAKAMRSRDAYIAETSINEQATQILSKCFASPESGHEALDTLEAVACIIRASKRASQPNPLAELFG
jgi:hypothetical protein